MKSFFEYCKKYAYVIIFVDGLILSMLPGTVFGIFNALQEWPLSPIQLIFTLIKSPLVIFALPSGWILWLAWVVQTLGILLGIFALVRMLKINFSEIIEEEDKVTELALGILTLTSVLGVSQFVGIWLNGISVFGIAVGFLFVTLVYSESKKSALLFLAIILPVLFAVIR